MSAASVRRRPLYQIDAFTRRRFAGNPAGVVLDADGMGVARMQAVARELNNSETAFVFRGGRGYDVRVRFFTPTTEVPLCGHATIAAHYARAVAGLAVAGVVRQRTGAGVLRVDVEPRRGGDFRIWMHQQAPAFGRVFGGALLARTLAALRIDRDALGDTPVQVVSTGHPKLLVPLASRALLDRLSPDLPALAAISRDTGCNGFHAFALAGPGEGAAARGRMFAPAIGIAEDPVTGNANGPLGAYLLHYGLVRPRRGRPAFAAWLRQGDAVGRPGRVRVEVGVSPDSGLPDAVRIGGDAVVAFQGELLA